MLLLCLLDKVSRIPTYIHLHKCLINPNQLRDPPKRKTKRSSVFLNHRWSPPHHHLDKDHVHVPPLVRPVLGIPVPPVSCCRIGPVLPVNKNIYFRNQTKSGISMRWGGGRGGSIISFDFFMGWMAPCSHIRPRSGVAVRATPWKTLEGYLDRLPWHWISCRSTCMGQRELPCDAGGGGGGVGWLHR